MSGPLVSVIIPVYNNERQLKECLQALARQTYQNLEVIVIDNGSSRPTVPEFPGRLPVRLEFESREGPYAARNLGITLARGEILAFTDSDCLPEPDWVEKGMEQLTCHPDNGVAGGRVDLFPRDARRFTPAETYESFSAFRQDRSLPLKHYSATANLFTFRTVLDLIGPFRADLVSGGDVEWCKRVHRAGYAMVYADRAGVRHPMRHSLADLAARHRRFARAEFDLQELATFSFGRILWHTLASLLPPSEYLFRIARSQRLRRMRERFWVLMVEEFVRGVRALEIMKLWRIHKRQTLHGSHR